ncbi:ABC transporter ATP-binding protein [Microbacterium terrisoli]|uniref:ABC transporter ATP-binding protein n=1 Tax=Microbacterium terrisoli TaxID=3242192 RepID=UPI0028050ABF|nr:ABC transporter ATP-binding protein [Microbacterium protaetiae]
MSALFRPRRRRSPGSTAEPVLVARRAGYTIDDQILLDPVDLSIVPGECIAVRGENGAGKTTLLRLLAGHARPTSGTVLFRGGTVDERRAEVRAHISTVIGPPDVYPDLTVREQLRLIATSWRMPHPEADAKVDAVLAALELAHLSARFAHELSSGQTQLYHLACAFTRPFDVLILDEPEQRLDPDRRAVLAGVLRGVRQQGAAIVFATHDPRLAQSVADRSLRLEPGL